MKFIGHRFAFAVAAAFIVFAGKGIDAVGVMRIDAGTNGVDMYLAVQTRKPMTEVLAWTEKFSALPDCTEIRNDKPYKFNRADAASQR